ncbi:MAG: YtxH domain-containing protein [Spirochaetes bacterium]|nr:MAG: YtxH domain-containing protein [Spirochaetota bacterium]
MLGVVIGGGLGALYYILVGCRTGSCPLTSTLYGSIAYGSVMGALLAGVIG